MKIYFAPAISTINRMASSEEMVSCYIKQSPKESGSWGEITYTTNLNEAEYLIIEDGCSSDIYNRFPPNKRLYFSREALDDSSHYNYPGDQVKRSSYWDGSGYLYTKWIYPGAYGGINMTYDELSAEKEINKTKTISCVQTDKSRTPIHKARQIFIKKYVHFYDIDVYGTISCANSELERYNNFGHDCSNKRTALDQYKYTLAFDNQVTIRDFFGTQVTDALLRWTVPIYGGGGELGKYFPEKSFIKINPLNLDDVDRVNNLVQNDDFDSRKEAIKEARDLILNKYNAWPTINLEVLHSMLDSAPRPDK
jgi:hypothetical protein